MLGEPPIYAAHSIRSTSVRRTKPSPTAIANPDMPSASTEVVYMGAFPRLALSHYSNSRLPRRATVSTSNLQIVPPSFESGARLFSASFAQALSLLRPHEVIR